MQKLSHFSKWWVYGVPSQRCIMRNTQYAVLLFITSNNMVLFNYFNYGCGRRDAKNISAAAALVYQKHNNNNNKNNIICARGMSCVHSHSRRRRGGVIVSRGGVGGNEVSRRGGDKVGWLMHSERGYDIIISYQPVCPPRSSTTCLCVTPLWPLAVSLFAPPSPGLPCSRGPRATALADSNAASCHHSTCSRVTCRTQPIVTVCRNVCGKNVLCVAFRGQTFSSSFSAEILSAGFAQFNKILYYYKLL